MARKKARGRPRKSAQKNANTTSGEEFEGPSNNIPQTLDARRTRTNEEVQGMPTLDFSSTSAGGTPQQLRLNEVISPPALQSGGLNCVHNLKRMGISLRRIQVIAKVGKLFSLLMVKYCRMILGLKKLLETSKLLLMIFKGKWISGLILWFVMFRGLILHYM